MTDRTLVMGIVNVTPDSFSDGGRWFGHAEAIAHGHQLVRDGAELLDIGGESTRPGATRPPAQEELRRVLPVVAGLRGLVPLSVDTMRAEVAAAVVAAGATIINDVSGGLADPDMLGTVAALGTDYVCQHWRGHGATMNDLANYDDVVAEVSAELALRVRAAREAGIAADRIIVDPGFGVAKTAAQAWELLAHLDSFTRLGHRVLVGVSRKRFLGEVVDGRPADQRDAATAAVSVLCAQQGIWAVRTHEVRAQRDGIAVVQRLRRTAGGHD